MQGSLLVEDIVGGGRKMSWPCSGLAAWLSSGWIQCVGLPPEATCAVVATMAFSSAVWIFCHQVLGWRGTVVAWLALEGIFVFANAWRYWKLNRQPERHHPLDTDPEVTFKKFCKVVRELDVGEQLTDWFFGCRLDELRSDNVADLFAYGFWYKTRLQMQAEGNEHILRDCVRLLKENTGVEVPHGHNPELQFRSHLWDSLPGLHLPLMFYALTEALGWLCHLALILSGFRKGNQGNLAYFTYGVPTVRRLNRLDGFHSRTPVVFVHGIGIGIPAYLGWILKLRRLGHPLIIIECRHTSMRLCFSAPSVDDTVSQLLSLMDSLQIPKAAMVSHSYGTFVASRFSSLHRDRVESMCLIDPVCFVMHNPTLLKNFVYRTMCYRSAASCLRSAMLVFVAREPSIAASVCRRFAWTALNLWPDELPDKAVVVLSAQDELVPVSDIQKLVRKASKADMLIHPMHAHAQFLMSAKWQATILEHISKVCL